MKHNSIKKISHADCTGCGACYNVCPKDAIEMKLDDEGFLCPVIDEEKCVDCGLCYKSCAVVFPKYENNEPKCYAVMAADDELRKKSSSGGMFGIIADYILKNKGYVSGAVYNKDFSVKHILINDRKDLEALRRSKYLQSDTNTIYKQIKEKLKKTSVPILFCGTPCQVAGLKSFLGKKYENLFTVDLVCHGVPSHFVLKKYLEEKARNREIESVNFRNKETFGWSTSVFIKFKNGEVYNKYYNDDSYYKAFAFAFANRESCGRCIFNKLPRQGDITIADFWGVDKYKKEFDDRKGTSLVFLNNSIGEKVFKKLIPAMKLCEEAPIEHAKKFNGNIYKSSVNSPDRKRFFKLLKHHSFEKSFDYASNKKFDVGMIGIWYGVNFGSILTNYALYRTMEKMGYSVLMIDKPRFLWWGMEYSNTIARRFGEKHYEISKIYNDNIEIRELNKYCNTFVTGSDQIWAYHLCGNGNGFVFLDFVQRNKKKISYATSFGLKSYEGPDNTRKINKHLLKQFDFISVREDSAVDICRKDFDVCAIQTLEPVFLCSPEEYDDLLVDFDTTLVESGDFITTYTLLPTLIKREILLFVSETLNMKLVNFLNPDPRILDKNKKLLGLANTKPHAEVEEWLYYMRNSKFIVTDSFHGVCFSILFRKEFILIKNREDDMSRFESLLPRFGLTDRLIYSKQELIDKDLMNKKIDYDYVWKKIDEERTFSLNWLKNALEADKKNDNETDIDVDMIYSEMEKLYKLLEEKNKRYMLLNRGIAKFMILANSGGLSNLSSIQKLDDYLIYLAGNSERLAILISAKDTIGFGLNASIAKKLNRIGIVTDLQNKHWHSFICIIDSARNIFENIAKETPISYSTKIAENDVFIESMPYNQGNNAKIIVDNIDFCVNRRGLNFVIIDKNRNLVIDSVCFDTHNVDFKCSRL